MLSLETRDREAKIDPDEERAYSIPSSVRPIRLNVVDDRPLIRSCFGNSLIEADPCIEVSYFDSLEALVASHDDGSNDRLVLYCDTGTRSQVEKNLESIKTLTAQNPDLVLILLSEIEELEDMTQAFKCGVRGYIPTSASLDIAIQAIRLVDRGGIYVPHSILSHIGQSGKRATQNSQAAPADPFTNRQLSVINALRKGKPNKIIAYELNMCESTVKVHIRNIMKRLNAKNRTEVAYLLNEMEAEGRLNTDKNAPNSDLH
ncbi:response regulator transcription factor [Jiella sp. MQZ9-1]|uniref:Response regulator transcription factor n=1 Tax=Jiella flava TaxID=2816857 RepID=A0A939FW35_9HYPH|nr:response regulator transcription factor [Jiella flava]MBO0663038.1 response regulator transcription factor [Jiella flava]MCD2471457.1 response regulator transcription factor [Jiella flava]